MASPQGRKSYDDAFAKMLRTPPERVPDTKPLSQRLREHEETTLPPRPAASKKLDFSESESTREEEIQALKQDNSELKLQMAGIHDLLTQLLTPQHAVALSQSTAPQDTQETQEKQAQMENDKDKQ